MKRNFSVTVNSLELHFNSEAISAREVLHKYNENQSTAVDLLVQVARGGERTILQDHHSIDLSVPGIERFEAFRASTAVYFFVNDKKYVTDQTVVTVNAVLEIAGLFPVTDYKLSLQKNVNENLVLSKEEEIKLQVLSTPHFRADLKDRVYTIQVDGLKHVLSEEKVTREQILLVAGKIPADNFELIQKLHDKRRLPITKDMWVDLSGEGAEKFVTIPCDQTEGAK